MIRLIDCNGEEFEDVWAKASTQLSRLANKFPDEIDWNPEYLLACIDNASAALMACDEGFYIVRENGPFLDVWVGASFDGTTDVLPAKLAELNKLAQESGFEAITFTTSRRGWNKVAPKAGFAVLCTTTTFVYRGQGNEEISTQNSGVGTGADASAAWGAAIH